MAFQRTKNDGIYLTLIFLLFGIPIAVGLGLFESTPTNATKAMNIHITHIGGWNVWWFIAFWMYSQCVLVHHARRGSKQQG
jgi:hypothetical protein